MQIALAFLHGELRETSEPVVRGTHVARPEVLVEQASSFTLRFPVPPSYETDGEYRRAASAGLEVTCVPRALRVVVPEPQTGRA